MISQFRSIAYLVAANNALVAALVPVLGLRTPALASWRHSLWAAGFVVGVALVLSYGFAALYFLRWRRAACLAVGTALATPLALLVVVLLRDVDWVTRGIAAWNCGVGSAWAVVYCEEHAGLATTGLVAVSVGLAWPLLYVDDRTFWTSVAALAAFDVFAVCAPCGSFRLVLAERQRRFWMAEPFADMPPGLVYESEEGFDLGTGDLVFYGVVVARAAMHGAAPAAAASLGVFTGLAAVVWLAATLRHAVPALPLALLLAALFSFAVVELVAPVAAALSEYDWYV